MAPSEVNNFGHIEVVIHLIDQVLESVLCRSYGGAPQDLSSRHPPAFAKASAGGPVDSDVHQAKAASRSLGEGGLSYEVRLPLEKPRASGPAIRRSNIRRKGPDPGTERGRDDGALGDLARGAHGL